MLPGGVLRDPQTGTFTRPGTQPGQLLPNLVGPRNSMGDLLRGILRRSAPRTAQLVESAIDQASRGR